MGRRKMVEGGRIGWRLFNLAMLLMPVIQKTLASEKKLLYNHTEHFLSQWSRVNSASQCSFFLNCLGELGNI